MITFASISFLAQLHAAIETERARVVELLTAKSAALCERTAASLGERLRNPAEQATVAEVRLPLVISRASALFFLVPRLEG